MKRRDELLVRRDRDEGVSGPAGERGRPLLGGRDGDGRQLVRERVQAGLLEPVVLAVVALVAALPEQSDNFDRLFEHLEPHVPGRPAVAEDVLVQVLARADAEEEAPRHHGRGRRGRLGDDRRMRADERTGDSCPDPERLGRLRDPAEDGPDERALALAIDPGMEVVGSERELEASLLRRPGVADEVVGRMLLRRERVAELDHPTERYPRFPG